MGARCWVSEGATVPLRRCPVVGCCLVCGVGPCWWGWVWGVGVSAGAIPANSGWVRLDWVLVGLSGGGRVCGWLFDLWIVCASILFLWWPSECGIRWMPWHQAPMKDVGGRDSPRGVVNRAVIRGCPNGGTQPELCRVAAV